MRLAGNKGDKAFRTYMKRAHEEKEIIKQKPSIDAFSKKKEKRVKADGEGEAMVFPLACLNRRGIQRFPNCWQDQMNLFRTPQSVHK